MPSGLRERPIRLHKITNYFLNQQTIEFHPFANVCDMIFFCKYLGLRRTFLLTYTFNNM